MASPSEFLKNVTAAEIKAASEHADEARDAESGYRLEGADYVGRVSQRLEDGYPGLSQQIEYYRQSMGREGADPTFVAGIVAGAIMLAHDLSIAAEVYDAERMLGDN